MPGLTGSIECGEGIAILLRGTRLGLTSLVVRTVHVGRTYIESLLMTIGASELTVEKHNAAGILASGRLRIRRNDSVRDGFHVAAFCGSEKQPWARNSRRRWIAGIRSPRQMTHNRVGATSRSADEQQRAAG